MVGREVVAYIKQAERMLDGFFAFYAVPRSPIVWLNDADL